MFLYSWIPLCKNPQQYISDYGHIAKHSDRAAQTGPWSNARHQRKVLHSREWNSSVKGSQQQFILFVVFLCFFHSLPPLSPVTWAVTGFTHNKSAPAKKQVKLPCDLCKDKFSVVVYFPVHVCQQISCPVWVWMYTYVQICNIDVDKPPNTFQINVNFT